MSTLLFISLFITFIHLTSSSQPKLIIELFRHGARGPLHHKNDPYWIGKEGQLTEVGRAQHLILGSSLIQRYPHLKTVLKDPSKLYLQSTNFNRTIESLKFHLWGIYHGENLPLNDLNIYDPQFYAKYIKHKAYEYFQKYDISHILGFAPAPIKINPLSQDYELLTLEYFACPKTDLLLGSEELDDFDFIMSLIGHQIHYHTKQSLKPEEIYALYDVYYADLYEGRKNSAEDISNIWNHLKYGAEYFVTHKRWGSELQRKLYGMPLFQKIIDFLEKGSAGFLPYDLVILSAHDITVFNLLTAFEIAHPNCFVTKMKGELAGNHCRYPNFASQLLIELWERDGETKIKILYEKEVVNLCKTADEMCSLSDLKLLFTKNFGSIKMDDILHHCGKIQCNLKKEDSDNLNKDFSICESIDTDW